ncbi:MAG: hypothetical protein QOG52_203, partial [Frankiaceae bacterium]|nr:hypothetical protein [Frankiaceae bacterium]
LPDLERAKVEAGLSAPNRQAAEVVAEGLRARTSPTPTPTTVQSPTATPTPSLTPTPTASKSTARAPTHKATP